MALPLAHLRVIDLTQARSGPTCVRQLADMGAAVIKIEPPSDRDWDHARHGSDFQNVQRNKRAMTLNLKLPRGVEILGRLVAEADVLVENYRPDVKSRLGIDYETLSRLNPRLVYGSISGFGQSGPYRDRPGYDQIAQGLGGLMSVTGLPGQGPVRVGIPVADLTAGIFLAQGILVALLERERSGRGQWVHTSLLESMVNLMDFQACRWLTDGVVPPQLGNDHPTFFPMGTYRCADGYVNIAGLKHLAEFLGAIGATELLDDERFATDEARKANRAEFNAVCEGRLAELTMTECVERLNALDIPAGPVYSLDQVFADPQVAHLALYETRPGTDGAPVALLRHPVTLTETPATVGTGPPRSGAHTREVLREVGYADEDIDALLASGAASDRADAPRWLT
jgi:crotonobetainyl-CoA:carnitine CoA-transferase CaiB-like acyl-CoA transferase